MDYPGSKLSKKIRQVVLSFFITAFFIISPIIILYTAGYRYDFHNGLLKETGALSIDVLPKNSIVFLNDIKITKKIPIRLTNLPPGKYKIKITAPEHYDWTKSVEVKNKQTVYIKEINLLRKNKPRLVLQKNIDFISISPSGQYAIYAEKKNNIVEVIVRDITKQNESVILRLPEMNEMIKVTWAKNNDYAAISNGTPPYKKLTLINVANPEKQVDVIKTTKSPVKKIQWKDSVEPELYFSTEEQIMSIKPQTEQKYVLSKNIFMDWYVEDGQIWTISADQKSGQIKILSDALGFKTDFSTIENSAGDAKNAWQIIFARGQSVLLKKSYAPEMLLVTPEKKFNISGEKFLFSEHNNWWLIWTPWELWGYSEGEEPYLINRSGEQLQEVIPLDIYNTLALVWAKKITYLFPYYLVSGDILNWQVNYPGKNESEKNLFFEAESGGKKGIWKLDY